MAQIGDAKGEYRGTQHRSDADLKAWLAKRPSEAALEPGLPIIDPLSYGNLFACNASNCEDCFGRQ